MILQLGWCAVKGLGSFLAHLCTCCIVGSVSLHSHCPEWRLQCHCLVQPSWFPSSVWEVIFADLAFLAKLPSQHFGL